MDLRIRSHGTPGYQSVKRGESNGCHRLHNFEALRLAAFLIKHHENERQGLVPEDYVRNLSYKGQTVALESESKGYRFKLTPPVPVTVLEGDVKGDPKAVKRMVPLAAVPSYSTRSTPCALASNAMRTESRASTMIVKIPGSYRAACAGSSWRPRRSRRCVLPRAQVETREQIEYERRAAPTAEHHVDPFEDVEESGRRGAAAGFLAHMAGLFMRLLNSV